MALTRPSAGHVGVTSVCPSYVSTGMFEGVKAPLLTPFLTPEKVADKVFQAVRKRRIFVREPWLVKITPLLRAVLPTSLSDRLADLFGASTSPVALVSPDSISVAWPSTSASVRPAPAHWLSMLPRSSAVRSPTWSRPSI